MLEFSKWYNCSLPEEILHNPKSQLLGSTKEIVEIIESNENVDEPLYYDEVVDMQDVTNLPAGNNLKDLLEVPSRLEPELISNYYLRGTKKPG